MPLNVRRFGASCLVFLLLAGAAFAQATGSSTAEDMQSRLARARAFVAVRSYTAAAFELEKIHRESNDPSVQNIALMLLMNCYLENGDYKHTQDLLIETFNALKTSKGAASSSYFTVSGQVIKTARTQLDRYKQLGLNVADPGIPAEVSAEIEKMRGTLEMVVDQTKQLNDSNRRSAEAFGLLEETTNARSAMARDAYDATRWKNEVADARERISNSQATVVNVEDTAPNTAPNTAAPNNATPAITTGAATVAQNNSAIAAGAVPAFNKITAPASNDTTAPSAADPQRQEVAQLLKDPVKFDPPVVKDPAGKTDEKPNGTRSRVSGEKADTKSADAGNSNGNNTSTGSGAQTASIGSLVDIATKKVAPVYPAMAKNMRVTGVVRVDVTLDEQGSVVSAQAQGPEVLKRAATDAIKQWKFKPAMRDGQPTKATGFVNFNFSL
jgi:TonB family protein